MKQQLNTGRIFCNLISNKGIKMSKKKKESFSKSEIALISKRFADARKQKSRELYKSDSALSYRELAKILDIGSHSTIQKIEKGTQEPSYEVIKAYINEFGGSYNYWLGQDVCKELENQEIQSKICLSEKAIDVLKTYKSRPGIILVKRNKLLALNYIIENMDNSDFLENMRKYLFYDNFTFVFNINNPSCGIVETTKVIDITSNYQNFCSSFKFNASEIPKIYLSKIMENITGMKAEIEKDNNTKENE